MRLQENRSPLVRSIDGEAIELGKEIKGPCATLVLCGLAMLSERVKKPCMNCKQHENIGKAMVTNNYGFLVQRDL